MPVQFPLRRYGVGGVRTAPHNVGHDRNENVLLNIEWTRIERKLGVGVSQRIPVPSPSIDLGIKIRTFHPSIRNSVVGRTSSSSLPQGIARSWAISAVIVTDGSIYGQNGE